VFTDRPFGGNQLAVFPHATGIADPAMQQLAREFNFSETTFVLPPSHPSCTCRVRILTARHELPFAGHATVGGDLAAGIRVGVTVVARRPGRAASAVTPAGR
ncbi:MAG TPA: PhzF family phenazine biosynthesis isomerase, partial [Streptosporangiaceae bacterium]